MTREGSGMKKRILIVSLLIIILLNACSWIKPYYSEDEAKKIIAERMEDLYDAEFKVTSIKLNTGDGYSIPAYTGKMKCKGGGTEFVFSFKVNGRELSERYTGENVLHYYDTETGKYQHSENLDDKDFR